MSLPKIAPEVLPRLIPILNLERPRFDQVIHDLQREVSVNTGAEEQVFILVEKSSALSHTPASERRDFADAIVGLHFLYSAAIWDRKAFFEDLGLSFASFIDGQLEDSNLSNEEAENGPKTQISEFLSRVNEILEIDSLRIAIKSISLIAEHERSYLSCRVFTDIRPVFADNLKDPLCASVVLHSIKLTTRYDGRQQSLFFAADSGDLIELKGEIDRALQKAQALTQRLSWNESFGVIVDPKEDRSSDE